MSDDNDRARKARLTFISELNVVRHAVGPPSYTRMRKVSEKLNAQDYRVRVLAESTTQDILACKPGRLPDWAWVASLVKVLRHVAAETGLDPDVVVGTQDQWHARLISAQAGSLSQGI